MCDQITTAPEAANAVEVVDIQFRPGQKVYYFDPAGIQLKLGDHVIIDTARGPDYGLCASGNHRIPQSDIVAPLRPVLRVATAQDERIAAENEAKERRAFEVCLQKIRDHGLDMQLVSAECAFDGSKLLFFFTADERVDFRDLVKDLAATFHTRIELRQIGVRDKAKMVGGLGICGRPFCCASFLDDFQPVSIKMAKTQNLSLNPTKISGTCGRLMCCLKYEQDAYEDLIKNSPKVESFVDTPEGRGTVVDIELLRQRVKVKMEEHPETISTFPISEIAVLRNGKAKKNDPPIPADLAPISGNGKRVKTEAPSQEPTLDPIRFRYSTETVVEEPEAVPVPEEAPEMAALEYREENPGENPEEKSGEKSQRRRNRKPKQDRPQGNSPEAQQEKPQERHQEKHRNPRERKPAQDKQGKQAEKPAQSEKPAEAQGEEVQKKKNHHRRSNYRHRKPKPSGEGGSAE